MTWQVENLGVTPLPSSQASSLVQCTTCTTLHASPDLQNEETEAHRIHSFANVFSGPFIHSTIEHLIQAKLCGNKMNKTWPPPSGNVQSIWKITWTKCFCLCYCIWSTNKHREVGSSIIIPVGQVEKQRVWDVQNHTQNLVLRWNQNPDPQISGDFLSLNSMLPALGSHGVAPDPSLAHSLSPKGGLSGVIFFPSLTSLGFLPDEGDVSVR